MNEPNKLVLGQSRASPAALETRLLQWLGRSFYFATLIGFGSFGIYIVLRATGFTFTNFYQWQKLVSGLPLETSADWIANLGIGMHYFMGMVLVLAWPILFSTKIRARHRRVHRWTGRVYVSAGFLAGVGGLSYIVSHGAFIPPASVAFAIWGLVMMCCAVMAFIYARARRFDLHRAWAIRLFAVVLGSWLFDIEYETWKHLTGGLGLGADGISGPVLYAILYLFFVPNLLVAEFFIRNKHKRLVLPQNFKWLTLASLAVFSLLYIYAIALLSATPEGKFGAHLLRLVSN